MIKLMKGKPCLIQTVLLNLTFVYMIVWHLSNTLNRQTTE